MTNVKKESRKANALLKKNADEDELLQNLQTLIFKREKVLEEVKQLKNDCDRLVELLLCSTEEDVELIIEEVFPVKDNEEEKFHLSTEEQELLVNRISLIENFNMQKIFGIGIRTTDDRSILAQFSPLPNSEDSEMYLVDFRRKRNSKLMVDHVVIPDFEVAKPLEDVHINQSSQDVPSYMYLIHQCLLSFWTKGLIMDSLKKEKSVNESKIYCNKTRTFITFIFKYRDNCSVEYKLLYDLTSVYPYKVQYRIISDREFPEYVTQRLDELKNLLLSNSVEKALLSYLNNEESSSTSESSSSASANGLEFFNTNMSI